MAWMRMMGADSVAYHEHTVADRADDHTGLALDYYGSRGETPLEWGGSGAELLGFLRSAVDDAHQTIVMVTHDPGAAARADRVVFLADGKVVREMTGPTTDAILEYMKTLGS